MSLTKKVLIITYYWPPAGGPGVQRWLKFIKYLPDFGVKPIVLVPDAAFYPILDANHKHELDDNLMVYRAKMKEPSRFVKALLPKQVTHLSDGGLSSKSMSLLTKLLVFIRGNFFVPDARVGWVKPAFEQVQKILNDHPDLQTIITTGPPHSLHLIGLKIKAHHKHLRWIADFRDPWTEIKYHENLRLTKKSKQKHKRLEHEVLVSADHILTSSWHTANSFKAISRNPITVLTNGFDSSDFDMPPIIDDKFSLTHVGALLPDRNPLIFWKSINRFLELRPLAKSLLEIRLVGPVDESILQTLNSLHLIAYTKLLGVVDHKSAVSHMMNSKILILIEAEQHVIPGKLFEYLHTGNAIAAVTPEDSDVRTILKNYPLSLIMTDDLNDNVNTLCHHFDSYEAGHCEPVAFDTSSYSRRYLSSQLAELL